PSRSRCWPSLSSPARSRSASSRRVNPWIYCGDSRNRRPRPEQGLQGRQDPPAGAEGCRLQCPPWTGHDGHGSLGLGQVDVDCSAVRPAEARRGRGARARRKPVAEEQPHCRPVSTRALRVHLSGLQPLPGAGRRRTGSAGAAILRRARARGAGARHRRARARRPRQAAAPEDRRPPMNLGRTASAILPAPIMLLAAVSLVAIALGACQRGAASAPNQDTGGAMTPSRYATIASGKVDVEGGVVEVAARHPGVVREVLVQEGDTVRKGQILARLEDREARLAAATARAAVAQARSQLALAEVALRTARREQERLTRLAPSGPVSRQQLDQAADNVTSAEAQLA